jgi:hypothetical protein
MLRSLVEAHMRRHNRCCPEALYRDQFPNASCLIYESWHLICNIVSTHTSTGGERRLSNLQHLSHPSPARHFPFAALPSLTSTIDDNSHWTIPPRVLRPHLCIDIVFVLRYDSIQILRMERSITDPQSRRHMPSILISHLMTKRSVQDRHLEDFRQDFTEVCWTHTSLNAHGSILCRFSFRLART